MKWIRIGFYADSDPGADPDIGDTKLAECKNIKSVIKKFNLEIQNLFYCILFDAMNLNKLFTLVLKVFDTFFAHFRFPIM